MAEKKQIIIALDLMGTMTAEGSRPGASETQGDLLKGIFKDLVDAGFKVIVCPITTYWSDDPKATEKDIAEYYQWCGLDSKNGELFSWLFTPKELSADLMVANILPRFSDSIILVVDNEKRHIAGEQHLVYIDGGQGIEEKHIEAMWSVISKHKLGIGLRADRPKLVVLDDGRIHPGDSWKGDTGPDYPVNPGNILPPQP